MLLQSIRKELVILNQALPENGLVSWTSGNVSIRDPETGYVAIKPSGVTFPDLTPESMVIVDLDGNVIEGESLTATDADGNVVAASEVAAGTIETPAAPVTPATPAAPATTTAKS